MTHGHQTRDMAVMISNGAKFEKAWKGLHPNSAGGVALDEVDVTTTTSADGEVESLSGSASDDPSFSESVTGLCSQHAQELDHSLLDAATRRGREVTTPPLQHHTDDDIDSSSATADGAKRDPVPATKSSYVTDESINSDKESVRASVTPSPSNTKRARDPPISLLQHSSSKNPSEEQYVPPEGKVLDKSAELRRRFEESVRESISASLGWRRTPVLYVWDEGVGGAIPASVDTWLTERYRSMGQHVQVPKICESLREKCLPLMRAPDSPNVISMDSLLLAARTVVRSLQLLQLRHACQWLHLLGDIVMLDTEEIQPDQVHLWRSVSPPLSETKERRGLQQPGGTPRNAAGGHLSGMTALGTEGRASRVPHDINLRRRLPRRTCKIIVDPSWFCTRVLVPIVCRSPSLSKNQAAVQPWCDKESVLSLQEIQDFLAPLKSSLNMTVTELLTALEVQHMGVQLTHMTSFCVPNRILGDKMKWLAARGIAKVISSQYSGSFSKVCDADSVSVILGRRVKAKYPHLIPPAAFHCLQSHMLQTWVRLKASSWQNHRLMCWERGVGITIEYPPHGNGTASGTRGTDKGIEEDSSNKEPLDAGKGGGHVCVLIETTPVWQQPDWSQSPGVEIDILAWGEGACTPNAVNAAVDDFVQMVYSAVQTVCTGALRAEGESEEALNLASIDWLRLAYLRPGCLLHTLALSPCDRNCGEYLEDPDSCEPQDAPIMVGCSHLQPRLCKQHLVKGYVVADSPGGGKGFLRSVFSALENGLASLAEKHARGLSCGPSLPSGSIGVGVSSVSGMLGKGASGGEGDADNGVDFQCAPVMASE